ncbi:hypothetical protein SHKM778_78850 [Streptomyces sp. KM77-8]|uniref:Uncharacterized protein n=1 Tax=Streptomyces haneummycinicus TaxID=3074435 RepID=A0AAT9HWY3_9ACTN
MEVSSTVKPSIAMKCIVQMPQPIDAAPRASQPGFPERPSERSDLVVQRSPSAPPRQATR